MEKIDRLGRITRLEYNVLDQVLFEKWYESNGTTLVRTIEAEYDAAGQLLEASDPAATYAYAYDNLGRVTSRMQTIDGLSFDIEYVSQYDANGSRIDLQAIIDGTDDFHNTHAYDKPGRLTSLVQAGVSGGHAVAEKRVDFVYSAAGRFEKIARYAGTTTSELVANTFYGYDQNRCEQPPAVRRHVQLHRRRRRQPPDSDAH